MIRNVILDWSGTVVDDLEAVLAGTNAVLAHFGHRALSREEFRDGFLLPFSFFYGRLLPGVPMSEIDRIYHQSFSQRRQSVILLPGASEFLRFCHSTGRRLFILSTMNEGHFEAEADRLNVRPYFDRVYVGVPDKRSKMGAILSENNLRADETLFAGDMVHDIQAGQSGGVLSVAVCTGFDSPEKLAGAMPDLMVRDLSSLQRVLDSGETDLNTADEWIEIVDQEVYCRLGVPDKERESPQRLLVSLRFKMVQSFPSLHDGIENTIDYAAVAAAVDQISRSFEMKLVESLVSLLADQLIRRFPMRQVRVSVKKFILPNTRWIEVSTERIATMDFASPRSPNAAKRGEDFGKGPKGERTI